MESVFCLGFAKMDELHFGPLKSQPLARLEVTPMGTHGAFDSLRVCALRALSPLQIRIGIFGSGDLKPDKSSPPRGLRVPRTARLASLLSRLMSWVEGVWGGELAGGPPHRPVSHPAPARWHRVAFKSPLFFGGTPGRNELLSARAAHARRRRAAKRGSEEVKAKGPAGPPLL